MCIRVIYLKKLTFLNFIAVDTLIDVRNEK